MAPGVGQQIQILHVDDDPSITDLTGTFLEREDDRFAVETATSADEGLERIDDCPPDCVVSDYNMPGVDGVEFLQAVRKEHPDLPFILFTGKGSEAVASDAISADVTDYLQKQSGSEQYELLANRIQNAVQARRETRRADRQEQLMRLTEFAGDTGGFEIDVDSGDLLLTDGTRRLVGLSDDTQITLEEAIELYHPDDQADVRQTVTRAAETGEETRGTWCLQTPDGDERIVDVTMVPAPENDDVTTLRGAIHDVTERRKRRRELREERRFIEQALDTLDDLFYVLDTDGTLRRWNDQVPQTTGYADSELADMRAIDLFPEDDRRTVADTIQLAVSGETVTVEADLLTADGERRPYELTGAQLTDADGNTTGLVGIGRNLTERRQHERRFQALVEESNDVISIVDADGVFQYQSPSIERVLGYEPEDTIGDTAWEYVHPDDRADLIEAFERGIADPDANPVFEYRARHADGSWRCLEANGNNQLDNPAVEGYVVNSRDITERKAYEQDLNRSRDLLSEMEKLADVGAWQYDPETDRLVLTDGVRRIHNLDSGTDLTLEAAFENFHPDDRDLLRDRFDTCLETGQPYEMDVRLATPDGDQRWITARGERVTDGGSGEVVRGYIQDITDRKQMERALEQERDLVTGIVETSPVGITVVTADGEISFTNDRASTIAGWPYEEVEDVSYNHSRYDLINEHGDPLESGETPFDRVVSQEHPIHDQVVGMRRPSGERVWLSVSGAPQYNGDGELERAVFAFEDITEQREHRQELQTQNERLEEFASIVSHDLRSPLTVAEGNLELAQETCQSDHLARAADAIDRSQALIDDLLALAREGDRVDETGPVELTEVAESSWQTVETRQATLDADAPQVIEADRSRLQELFENLYRNAVEHGGDDVTVSVGATDDGFYVADTGPGIPESDREEVFEAGYSTNEDGTGFGLRIVEQIADAHGWSTTVTENQQGGARFKLTGVEFVDR